MLEKSNLFEKKIKNIFVKCSNVENIFVHYSEIKKEYLLKTI